MSSALRSVCLFVVSVYSVAPLSSNAEDTLLPPQPALALPASPAAETNSTQPAAGADNVTEPAMAVISANRFKTTIDTAPTNITVITAAEIRDSNALNLADAINRLGGVRVQTGAGTNVDLAGFGATGAQNSLILLNGRRLNDVDLSGANLGVVSLQDVERVEIVQGSSAVLYGDNAVGGVINIVTKTGFDGPYVSGFLRDGSFAAREIGVQGRWSNDRSAIVGDVNRLASDGYRDHSNSEITRAATEFTQQGDAFTWGARAFVYRDDNELAGALTEEQYQQHPSQAGEFLMDTKEAQNSIDAFMSSPTAAMEFGWRTKSQESASTYLGSFAGRTSADLTTLSLTPRHRSEDESRTRVVGADLYRSTLETHATFTGPDNRSDVTRNSVAVYASDTQTLGSVMAVEFGVRAQNVGVNLKNRDVVSATASQNDKDDLEYAWDLALQFRYPGGARSHIRVARSFRFPVLDEMWSYYSGTITLLDPQVGRHVEAGGQFPFSKDTQFDASVFRITLDDEIGFDPLLYANVNLEPTQHHGADVSFKTKFFERWSLRLMHSYREAKFRSGPLEGKRVPDVPKQHFTATTSIDAGPAGLFNIDAQYVGPRYFGSDYMNSGKKMDSYTRFNTGWSHTFPHGRVRVGIDNVFDKKTADSGIYSDFSSAYYFYSLPGRTYSVTVQSEF